jgi:hypothetical protein
MDKAYLVRDPPRIVPNAEPAEPEETELDGGRWTVKGVRGRCVRMDQVEKHQSVYCTDLEDAVIVVPAPVNNITLDRCKNVHLYYHSTISLLEVVHCSNVLVSVMVGGRGSFTFQCDLSERIRWSLPDEQLDTTHFVHAHNIDLWVNEKVIPTSCWDQRWTGVDEDGTLVTKSIDALKSHGIVCLANAKDGASKTIPAR